MKDRFKIEQAYQVATDLCASLNPYCTKVKIVGSIRRKKKWVGDIELLIIPSFDIIPNSLELFPTKVNITEQTVQKLRLNGTLELRKKKNGTTADGSWVKLLKHVETSIPVDLFFATQQTWISALVCRTGGKDNNEELASRAKSLGYRWEMNGPGFKELNTGKIIQVKQEQDIYQFLGLPYLRPELRQ